MLLDEFASAMAVKAPQEILDQAIAFTRQLEFETVDVMAVLDGVTGQPIFRAVDNVSQGVARRKHDDTEKARHDPVMQHCKHSHVPIAWDRKTYEQAELLSYWEEQAPFGFSSGIAVASHLPNGRHLMIGMDRDVALPEDKERITWLLARLQLFCACALESSLRVLLGELPEKEASNLTARELEAMRWTMEGKTAWEVGRILGISEQTAARHLSNATQKLGCNNKMHAVVKALRLGLLR